MYDDPFGTGNIFYTGKNKKHPNAAHRKVASVYLQIKRSCKTKAVKRASWSRNGRIVSYKEVRIWAEVGSVFQR